MQLKFNPQDITMTESVSGVKGDAKEDPRIDALEELQERVEDDFDYVIAGVERLTREGLIDDAINMLNTLADTLNSAISIIGDDFDKGE